jgi:putative ABC transport system permease protein
MYLYELLKIALTAIRANKVRGVLTVLGIIIGIAAVIAMISVGQGAQNLLMEQVQGLGSNTITIFPVSGARGIQSQFNNRQFAARLDHELFKVLDNDVNFPEITAISPELNTSKPVSYKSVAQTTTISGVTKDFYTARDREVVQGRGISEDDDNKLRNVATLGSRIATTLFGENTALDQQVKIDGKNYRVIGIHEELGGGDDNYIYIPLNNALYTLTGERDYSQIVVKVGDENEIDPVATKIETSFLKYFRKTEIENAPFSVFTSKDVISLTQSITSVFTTLLASIAGISLVVVSVTERTREIGLRKAVGAKQNAILLQFLLESVVLTITGGVIGIIIGALLGLLVGKIGDIPTEVSWQAIVLATSVSATIGIVFGFYPAYRAAKLNPIDALRYE